MLFWLFYMCLYFVKIFFGTFSLSRLFFYRFKSFKFARICDFHINLWGYTSFLAKKTEGNEKFDLAL